jgi:hypothetical protein
MVESSVFFKNFVEFLFFVLASPVPAPFYPRVKRVVKFDFKDDAKNITRFCEYMYVNLGLTFMNAIASPNAVCTPQISCHLPRRRLRMR